MVLEVICTSRLSDKYKQGRGLYPFLVRIEMPIFYYISRHSAPGLSVGTIILSPFPPFFRCWKKILINKRKKSDPTAAGGNNVDLDITAPTLMEKTATELCSFAIIWWSFLSLFVFFKIDGIWGPEGGVPRRRVKRTQLWRYDTILINWIFFSFSRLLITSRTYYGLRLTTPLSCLFTSDLICGFSQWVGRKDNKTSQKSRFAASFFSCRSTVRNPPPLLVLINRHSWRFSFW